MSENDPDETQANEPDPLGVARALTKPYPGMGEALGRRKSRRVKGMTGRSSNCFHLMSRICEGVPFFDETDKEALVVILRRLASFCGIKLLTYCVMGNHFHALIRVPEREEWLRRFAGPDGEARLLEHLRILYSKGYVELLAAQWLRWRQDDRCDLLEASKGALLKRFCDISKFGKEVKVRFARWFNKRHNRRGVLWMARFKSVLVEGQKHPANAGLDALKVMAAYIDLNPVRAQLASDAASYRWSGWTAALGGEKEAVAGLCDVVDCSPAQWQKAGISTYRSWVSEQREDNRNPNKLLESVLAFTGGVALGSESFVEEVFKEWRTQFGPRRADGARPVLKHSSRPQWAHGMRTLRDLKGLTTGQSAANAADATSAVC